MPLTYIRLAAYGLLGASILSLGWYLGRQGPERALEALKAQGWQAKAQANQAALTAVQGQLKQAQATASNNASTLQVLQSENAKIAADRDSNMELARRLLNSARTAASSGAVSAADHQPTASDASGNPGAGQVTGLLVDAADESQECAIAYNTLLAQLKPQL